MATPERVVSALRLQPPLLADTLGLLLAQERVALPWAKEERDKLLVYRRRDPFSRRVAEIGTPAYEYQGKWQYAIYDLVFDADGRQKEAQFGLAEDFDEADAKVSWFLGKRGYMVLDPQPDGTIRVTPSLLG